MKFTQKYTIIQLLEEVPDGTEFPSSNWPLHTTIVDTFAIDWSVPVMTQHLADLLHSFEPFGTTAGRRTFFGPNQETEVTLLRKTPGLVALHNAVVDLLEKGSLKLNNPQFAREGFLPHATVQRHAELNEDDNVPFTALSIIDMFPGDDPYKRKVITTIKLSKP